MIRDDAYYYNRQVVTYIRQFMAIFTGLQVQVGKSDNADERLISVPIAYGGKDRVVASILADNTQNKMIRLPTLAAYVRNLRRDMSRVAGTGMERRNVYTPVGGLVGEDTRVLYQRKPTPYVLEMELSIFVSNTDQHFQILEQILPIFDPLLTIQTSDAIFDWKRLTSVELTGITFEQPYPSMMDRRIIQSTITFDLPIWIEIPSDERKNIIEKILVRIGAVSNTAGSSSEIIAELDAQGLEYEVWADATDLKID